MAGAAEAGADADLAAWSQVVEVDSLRVQLLVDNETDGLSTPCGCCDPALEPWAGGTRYTSEFARMAQASAPCAVCAVG